jgi:hypothetical protein
MSQIIRAIPQVNGPFEQYYDVSMLPWKQVRELKEELGQQGFYVQDILLNDPMPIMVGAEMRRRLEDEKESQ